MCADEPTLNTASRRNKQVFVLKHIARKRFGQHFLADSATIAAIVRAIDPRPGQPMLEIGPGLAALTQPLVERLGHLAVVELDRDLAARLRDLVLVGGVLMGVMLAGGVLGGCVTQGGAESISILAQTSVHDPGLANRSRAAQKRIPPVAP